MAIFAVPFGIPVFCAIFFIGCGMFFKSPAVNVKNVELKTISLSSLVIDVTVTVDNKNPLGIRIQDLDLDIFFKQDGDWIFLSHGEHRNFKIKTGSCDVTFPLTIRNAELLSAIIRIIAAGKITLQVKGTLVPDFLILSPKVPFCHTMVVPEDPGNN